MYSSDEPNCSQYATSCKFKLRVLHTVSDACSYTCTYVYSEKRSKFAQCHLIVHSIMRGKNKQPSQQQKAVCLRYL